MGSLLGRSGRHLRPRGLQLLPDKPRQLERLVGLLRILEPLLPRHPFGHLLHPAHRRQPGDAQRPDARSARGRTVQERSPLPARLVLLQPPAPVRPLRAAGRRGAARRPRPRRRQDEPAPQLLRRVRGLYRRRTGRHHRQRTPAAALHLAGRQGLRPRDAGHVHGAQKPRAAAGGQPAVQRQSGLRQRREQRRQAPLRDRERSRKMETGGGRGQGDHRPEHLRPLQGVPHRRDARSLHVVPQRLPGKLEQRGDDGSHLQQSFELGAFGVAPPVQRLRRRRCFRWTP